MNKYLFRYDFKHYEYMPSLLECDKFLIIRETKNCYVIKNPTAGRLNGKDMFIIKYSHSKSKRFACNTPANALNSYIKRKHRQIDILESQLKSVKRGLKKALSK